MSLSCEQAEHALRVAKEKAIEIDRGPVGIAVVDARGDLICCVRMDGARWYTADVARSKAFASSTWGKTTKDLQATIADNPVVRTVISLGNDFISWKVHSKPNCVNKSTNSSLVLLDMI